MAKVTIEEDDRDYRNPYVVTYELRPIDLQGTHEPKLLSLLIDERAIQMPRDMDRHVTLRQPNLACWHTCSNDWQENADFGEKVQAEVSAAIQRYREFCKFGSVSEEQSKASADMGYQLCDLRRSMSKAEKRLDNVEKMIDNVLVEISALSHILETADIASEEEISKEIRKVRKAVRGSFLQRAQQSGHQRVLVSGEGKGGDERDISESKQ